MDGRERLKCGASEKVALEETKSLTEEEVVFGKGFDAFRDDFDFEVVAGAADGAEDVLARAGAIDAADEAHVELDLIGLEIVEEGKAGVGSAEVVDGEADAEGAGFFHERGEVRAVVDDGGFGDFEDDAIGGKAGLAGGFDGSEDRLRPGVEGLRQKIEVQGDVDAEADGEGDGAGAKDLIERMEAQGGDLIEDLPGRFVPCAADESFVGDNFFGYPVDDGLEGEAEGRVGGMVRFGAHGVPVPETWMDDDMVKTGFAVAKSGGGTLRQWDHDYASGVRGILPKGGTVNTAKALQRKRESEHRDPLPLHSRGVSGSTVLCGTIPVEEILPRCV